MNRLQEEWQKCREEVARFSADHFANKTTLIEAMLYTLNQGKKFRPFLSYATTHALERSFRPALAYAVAVEMIHAFSLIHDDLPALDNDDYRRGMQTNHKVYGEAMAVLAGDALLNEAFAIIAQNYIENPILALRLVQLVSRSVGTSGMIEGQARDLNAQREEVEEESLSQIHQLKTGALINASVQGAALIVGASDNQLRGLQDYGKNLGLAFQIADDLLEEKAEIGSYVHVLGKEKAKERLHECSEKAIEAVESLPKPDLLIALVVENRERKI